MAARSVPSRWTPSIPSATPSASPTGARMPSTPSRPTSATPPARVATTGIPPSMASRSVVPSPSSHEVRPRAFPPPGADPRPLGRPPSGGRGSALSARSLRGRPRPAGHRPPTAPAGPDAASAPPPPQPRRSAGSCAAESAPRPLPLRTTPMRSRATPLSTSASRTRSQTATAAAVLCFHRDGARPLSGTATQRVTTNGRALPTDTSATRAAACAACATTRPTRTRAAIRRMPSGRQPSDEPCHLALAAAPRALGIHVHRARRAVGHDDPGLRWRGSLYIWNCRWTFGR